MTEARDRNVDLDDPMPGFRGQLSARLAKEARRANNRRARRRVRGFASAAAVAAIAVVVLFVANISDRGSNTAYGRLRVLDAPVVDATRQLNGGLSVTTVLGPGARLDRARAIPFYGLDAYLVTGKRGWCLSVPDHLARDPEAERGVTCALNADVERFGISMRIGRRYLAAIPEGVRNPTITSRAGTIDELLPNSLGVVVADSLRVGDVITTFAIDGERRVQRLDRL